VSAADTGDPVWDWDKAGGGTNHEMEHAIKCITQAMLNFLSQKNNVGYSAMHNILYKFFYNILKGLKVGNSEAGIRAKEISRKITMMLRKQQVAAGLPSCALFNQFKCAVDLIKIELIPIPGTGWFYVIVRPDKEKIMNLVLKMRGEKSQSGKMNEKGEYVEKGGCNFYGMNMEDDKKPRSVWKDIDRLKRCYSQDGAKGQGSVKSLLNDESQYEKEVNYTYNLKNISVDNLVNLIMGRTSIVCEIYNQILNCAGDKDERGMKLSGIIIASSLLMLSINMGEVLESDKNLETSNEPQLYELGGKASAFLTNLLNRGELESLLTDYENSGDYTRFMSLINNPTTRTYLEMARSLEQLNIQGGGSGSLPVDVVEDPEDYHEDLKSGMRTPLNTQQKHLSEGFVGFAEGVRESGGEKELKFAESDMQSLSDFTQFVVSHPDASAAASEDAIQLFVYVDSLFNIRYSGEGKRVLCEIVNGTSDDVSKIFLYIDYYLKNNRIDKEIDLLKRDLEAKIQKYKIKDEELIEKYKNSIGRFFWREVFGGVVDKPPSEDMDTGGLQPEYGKGSIMGRPTPGAMHDSSDDFLDVLLDDDFLSLSDSDSDSEEVGVGKAEMAQKKKRKKKKHKTRKKPSQKKKKRRKRTRKK